MEEYWYRYEDHMCAGSPDQFDNYGPSTVHVTLRKFKVLKHTKTGVQLDIYYGERRFTKRNAFRRWACPTIDEALESFIARKERQIFIYRNKINNAQDAIIKAKRRFLCAT
jgi:hypothetical protein